jgi:hypothetical protein
MIIKVMNENPNSDIELPVLVQQRPFNILLDDPVHLGRIVIDIVDNVPHLGEDLDTSPLVQSCWFQDPLVHFTVLLRHTFHRTKTFTDVDFTKASTKLS